MSYTVDNIGDTVDYRTKHTDGIGNFSIRYVSDNITTTEIPCFNMYSQSLDCKKLNLISAETGETLKTIKQWLPDIVTEDNFVMAWNSSNNLLYRITFKHISEDTFPFLETVDLITLNIVDVPLTGNVFDIAIGLSAMVYLGPIEDEFLFLAASVQDGGGGRVVSVTSSGVVTHLSDLQNVSGLASDGLGNIRAAFSDAPILAIIDPDTGELVAETDLLLVVDVGEYIGTVSLTNYDGTILAIGVVALGDGPPRFFLGSIDLDTGLVTNLGLVDYSFGGIAAVIAPFSEEETSLTLIGQTRYEYFFDSQNIKSSLYFMDHTNGSTGSLLVSFNHDQVDDTNNSAICVANGFSKIYHLAKRHYPSDPTSADDGVLILETLDPYSLETEVFNLTMADSTFISDGGHDMFDDGNYLNTNLSDNPIAYTHSTQSFLGFLDYPEFVGSSDGVIVNDSVWFGDGSEYFTNMYRGIFVLAASNITISSFFVGGELGADSDGSVTSDENTIIVSGIEFRIFWKQVYGTDDPSVNHLIMVPLTADNYNHTISSDTNDDTDVLDGLSETKNIYYLLFAARDEDAGQGYLLSSDDIANVATAFLNIVVRNSNEDGSVILSDLLVDLNASRASVVAEIPHVYSFVDSSVLITSFNHCLAYHDSGLYVINSEDSNLHVIGFDGKIRTIGNPDSMPFFAIIGMTFVRDTLYMVDFITNYLMKIDPYTGKCMNLGDFKFTTTIDVEAISMNGFYSLDSYGPHLYASLNSLGTPFLIFVEDENFEGFNGDVPGVPIAPMDTTTGLAIELIPTSMQLFGVTDVDSGTFRPGALYNLNTISADNADVNANVISLTKRWNPNYVTENNFYIAYNSGYIWRMKSGSLNIGFQKIDPETSEVTDILFSDFSFFDGLIKGFAYNHFTDGFMVDLDTGFYSLTKEGVITRITNSNNVNSMVFLVDTLFAIKNNNRLYMIDPSTGAFLEFDEANPFFTITVATYTVDSVFALMDYNGVLYALANLSGGASNGPTLITIDPSNGVGTYAVPLGDIVSLTTDTSIIWGQSDSETSVLLIDAIYQIGLSEEVTFGSPIPLGGYLFEIGEAIAWNPDDRKMYHFTVKVDDRNFGASVLTAERMDMQHLEVEELGFTFEGAGDPLAVTYAGNYNFWYIDNNSNFYSLEITDDIVSANLIATDEAFASIKGLACNATYDVLYAVLTSDNKVYTLDMVTGVLTELVTVMVEPHVVAGFTGLTRDPNSQTLYYAIFVDSGEDHQLVSIDLDTGIGTYKGILDSMNGLAFAVAPLRTAPLVASLYSEFEGKLAIIVSKDDSEEIVNTTHLIAEWHKDMWHYFTNNERAPDDGWNQVEILDVESDGSNWRIVLDMLSVPSITVRIAYRNPDSAWRYTLLD